MTGLGQSLTICTVQLMSQPFALAGPQALAIVADAKMNSTANDMINIADPGETCSFNFLFILRTFSAFPCAARYFYFADCRGPVLLSDFQEPALSGGISGTSLLKACVCKGVLTAIR
jgi:hypothetical protein